MILKLHLQYKLLEIITFPCGSSVMIFPSGNRIRKINYLTNCLVIFCAFLLSIFLLLPCKSTAQVTFGGLVDLEVRKGGNDSAPWINQTPGNKLSIYTPAIRLFADASFSEKWFVQSTLQADYYRGPSLSPAFFSVININWLPYEERDFLITAGRFVTPYGRYSRRFLSSDNPFVHLPLSHSWNLPIDNARGIYYGELQYDDVSGQSIVYQRMYSQGLSISNLVLDEKLYYELAAAMAPPSTFFDFGKHNLPAFISRMEFFPVIWAEIGLSFSFGSYMNRNDINRNLTDSELRSFTQTLAGADATFSYLYYSIAFDLNFNRWKAPYISDHGEVVADDLIAEVIHASTELQYRFPFLPGGYSSLRFDALRAENLKNKYDNFGSSFIISPYWAPDINRVEWTTGYKINRNVLFKISWLVSWMPGADQQLDDDVIAFQISTLF